VTVNTSVCVGVGVGVGVGVRVRACGFFLGGGSHALSKSPINLMTNPNPVYSHAYRVTVLLIESPAEQCLLECESLQSCSPSPAV
jgi:hypothetical protein